MVRLKRSLTCTCEYVYEIVEVEAARMPRGPLVNVDDVSTHPVLDVYRYAIDGRRIDVESDCT